MEVLPSLWVRRRQWARISIMATSAIHIDPGVQGGTPCFRGTRVPVSSLFDHLEGGYTIDYFLTQFPRVGREQVIEVLEWARASLGDVTVGAKG
jgi:uncharacterized protein (DUF433 family)